MQTKWGVTILGSLLFAGCPTLATGSTPTTPFQPSTIPPPAAKPGSSTLKPIDQAALQAMVDTTARELLLPGAVVLLRTPHGEFTAIYGTHGAGHRQPAQR